MRLGELVRESLAAARAQRVPTATVALLVAVMCAVVLVTVGRTAGAHQQVSDRMEAAGSRLLTVTDVEASGLLPLAVVSQVAGLSTVDVAVGFGRPVDVVNGAVGEGGTKVPTWTVTGALADVVRLTAGRWPEPGEALVSARSARMLGLEAAAGYLIGGAGEVAVVGMFEARSPFEDYENGAVVAGAPEPAHALHVVVSQAQAAAVTQSVVLDLVAAPDVDDLTVTSPTALADLQGQLSTDMRQFGRGLLYAVLAAGGTLVAVVVLADVLVRRKDLGRRRALGASRATVLLLVVLRTVWPAIAGAAAGTAAGLALGLRNGVVPPLSFAGGTAVLAVLCAVLAAIPPAVLAARRDPVRVLRTP